MNYEFETRAVHAGQDPEKETGAVIPAISMSTTFRQDGVGNHKGYEYSRTGNPTRHRLEQQVASLENAKYGLGFASGSSATASIQLMLNEGDHIITADDVYGGTYRFFDKVMRRFNLSYDYTGDMSKENLQKLLKPNTRMIWMETPSNPLLKVFDINTVAEFARDNNLILVVDNTFASPYIQNPLDLGADLVMHSSTKYLGGHSDVVGGIVVTNSDKLADELRFLQNSAGAIPSPFDSWLLSRGIKTLPLRMQRHSESALKIANYLEKNESVSRVYYPHLESHNDYQLAKEQMRLGGGIVSFDLENKEIAEKFLSELKLFYLAESLGGVESLAEYPPTMTHGSIEPERRKEIGINDGLVRLSVGIENVNDLIKDIQNAFDRTI